MAEKPELDVLLGTERTFPPPSAFARDAVLSDPAVYEQAAADPEAWWAAWADRLEWIEPWETVLDWSDPPHANGSTAASSTSAPTASTVTSPPERAGGSPFTGRPKTPTNRAKRVARRSPTNGCSIRPSASPTC